MLLPSRSLHRFFQKPTKNREHLARKLIGYSDLQMYEVVSDVKNYKYFVPFCTNSIILKEEPGRLRGNLEIGFLSVKDNFTSIVTLVRPKLVTAICKDGMLFNTLESRWRFSPGLRTNPKTCIVDFYLNFEFKSVLYHRLANMFFEQLVDKMEDAFIKEVERRNGPSSIPIYPLQPPDGP